MTHYSHAIVRPPARSFASGLTSAKEGSPDYGKATEQHGKYCEALKACGLKLTYVAADEAHPDSTFVEDTAIICARGAVITMPGAPSRRGEIEAMSAAVQEFFPYFERLQLPGTLDAGDVACAEEHFFIGLSERTNALGADQLAAHLGGFGFGSSTVDMSGTAGLLHLKTGISYLGEGCWAIVSSLDSIVRALGIESADRIVVVDAKESYATNCVRINDRVLVAQGYPRFTATLRERGFAPLEVDVSEFRKMDGGLSCLSLRF